MTPPLTLIIQSPLGPLCLTVSSGAVTALTMGSPPPPFPPLPSASHTPDRSHSQQDLDTAKLATTQLEEYFAGTLTSFTLPLAPRGTPFRLSVWKVLQTIPCGQTRSYASIAAQVDPARAHHLSRAIGRANGANPIGIIIPCHRVIAKSGHLSGYAGGVANKAWLLKHEGAR